MDELKQQFYEVMHKYQKPFSEEGVTAKCHVLFCEDEEVGCVGAKKFTRGSLRPQVNYIVELDRRGSNDAVFYRCDNPEFEDFITSFGFETAGGSRSDISVSFLEE